MELPLHKPEYDQAYKPGYVSEYADRYRWDEFYKSEKINHGIRCEAICDVDVKDKFKDCCVSMAYDGKRPVEEYHQLHPPCVAVGRDPAQFKSDVYPCVYREMKLTKDDRGKYIDPYQDVITTTDGRRLMYDSTHPEMIYGSQWSAELADAPGPYSFPVTTGLDAEIPWTKDLQWQVESEVGRWPTDKWKEWTKTAACPCYDGHDDQIQYSKYKVQFP